MKYLIIVLFLSTESIVAEGEPDSLIRIIPPFNLKNFVEPSQKSRVSSQF